MVRETSIKAYYELRDSGIIGKREGKVLRAILDNPNSTDREIAHILGYSDPNKVRPRRKGLFDLGIVADAGKRSCTISNKNAHIWSIKSLDKNEVKRYKVKQKRCICPMCNGKGYILKPQTTLEGYQYENKKRS